MVKNQLPDKREINTEGGNCNEHITGDYKQIAGICIEKLRKLSSKRTFFGLAVIASLSLFSGVFFYNSNSSTTTSGDNSPAISNTKGNVDLDIRGDTTTSAEARYDSALSEIKDELQSNFLSLSLTIQDIENNKPQTFWDVRRANETELAYQDRSRIFFQEYINGIGSQIKLLDFNQEAYKGLRNNLAHDSKSARSINNVYKQLNEVEYHLTSFESVLNHILSLNLSDQERTAQSDSLLRENMASARIHLSHAAAYFCLALTDEIDVKILSDSLNLANINVNLKPGKAGYQEALRMASQFTQQKKKVIEKRIVVVDEANKREVTRLVKDPYLALLRKASGLPPTLSDGEVFALQNRKINQEEKEPVKLFQLAASSFLESDGHASAIYFERAIKSSSLSPLQEKFARLSIDRLNNPEVYEDSLGIMVVKVTPSGNFDQAGLKIGDVIVTLNGKTINEPGEIASELGKSGDNPILLGVIREGKYVKKVIKGGESAGATLSTLIILNAIQL